MNSIPDPDDDMPAEIDFSHGVRGKFHRPGALLKTPVYLDDEVQSFLAERASAKGVEVAALVNSCAAELPAVFRFPRVDG